MALSAQDDTLDSATPSTPERICPDCEDVLPENGSGVFTGDCGYKFCGNCAPAHEDCACEYENVDKDGRRV